MRLVRSLARMGYHQLRNIYRFGMGEPLTLAPLSSSTLDEDDVELAKYWLNHREDWYRLDEVEHYNVTFANWNGSSYAFSFMGGRIALSAIIYALGLTPDDEVILPGYTCIVVPNAFHYQGVKTIYSDIELETYGLDASLLQEKISSKTKAILLHHLYGLVCRDYEEIIAIARRHGLYVIEDCAHSTGAMYKGKKVGNFGDAAFYSSEQSKVFNTIQGGVAVTNNPEIASKINQYVQNAEFPDEHKIDCLLNSVTLNYLRSKHPQRWWRGDWADIMLGHKELVSTTKAEEQGVCPLDYGRKMPAPIAALGLNQLKKIDAYNERRRQNARYWDQWCEFANYKKPLIVPDSLPVYLRYPVLVEARKKIDSKWAIKELGVNRGVWFVSHLHPVPQTVVGCPNADQAVKQCINFPGILDS